MISQVEQMAVVLELEEEFRPEGGWGAVAHALAVDAYASVNRDRARWWDALRHAPSIELGAGRGSEWGV